MTASDEIDRLLAEPIAAAEERQRTVFPALLRETDGSVVLFGAGRLGRRCARALRRGGVPLRAFCDRNAALHGATVEGAVVLEPEEAVRRFGASALLVVSIWTGTARESMAERIDYLRRMGGRQVTNYASLVWAHGREETPFHSFDLPTRVLEAAPAIRGLAGLLADEVSRRTLAAVLRQRLRGEFDATPRAPDQYFPRDVVALRDDEGVVDGGAFTGDTLDDFLRRTGARFGRYDAFEPDPTNADNLRRRVAALPDAIRERIRLHTAALHARNEPLAFTAEGRATSKGSPGGSGRVVGVTLDSALPDEAVTFLKLDVEGMEREALTGAQAVLKRCGPLAAVCVYHAPADLWEIPLFLHGLLPDHRFYLRQHQFDGYEIVCYAVPRERVPGGLNPVDGQTVR